MSLIHNITAKHPLDIDKLNSYVSKIDNAIVEWRDAGIYYYWIDGKSTRGFDITITDNIIEVRNTVLSNSHDYELTNQVVAEILNLTDGILLDEEEEQINTLPLFENDKIKEMEIMSCVHVRFMSKEYGHIAIYGPVRKVHFGTKLYETYKELNDQQLVKKMFDLIVKVNYEIPNYDYGNVMEVGNPEDDKKIMKLLTNETDYIIDKYDYILLHRPDETPIMITNEILNTMLPSNWTLVDEYTVVAPKTSNTEWKSLLNKAKDYDLWDTFKS